MEPSPRPSPALAPVPGPAPAPVQGTPSSASRWERLRPVGDAVLVAAAAKLAVVLLTFILLGRPDDFWHRMAWQWDGEHYLGIAKDGYDFHFTGRGDSVHFAFLYPMVIRLFGGSGTAALAINNVCSLAAVAVIAWHWGSRPAMAFALFPAWLVYGTVGYSEGLYVMLAALGIAGFERGRQAVGGLAAGAAACARYLGGPALWLAAFPWKQWRNPRSYVAFAVVSASGLAIALWMWYQTGEPLGYYESQKPWGGKVAWPWEHFEWLLHGWFTNQGGPVGPWGNLGPIDFVTRDIVFAVPVAAGIVLLWQRTRASPSFVYSLAIFLTALCTSGTPAAALPRYVAVAFPAIAVLGERARDPVLWMSYALVGIALGTHGMSHHLFRYWS